MQLPISHKILPGSLDLSSYKLSITPYFFPWSCIFLLWVFKLFMWPQSGTEIVIWIIEDVCYPKLPLLIDYVHIWYGGNRCV